MNVNILLTFERQQKEKKKKGVVKSEPGRRALILINPRSPTY